jgi:hypothetical protein
MVSNNNNNEQHNIMSALHHHYRQHQHQQEDPMTVSLSSAASAAASATPLCWSMIQHMNNRGCTHIMKGNYAEANRIFKLAIITRHKQMVGAAAASTTTTTTTGTSAPHPSSPTSVDADHPTPSIIFENAEENYYNTAAELLDDDYDYDEDEDEDDDDDDDDDDDYDEKEEDPNQKDSNQAVGGGGGGGIPRMTSISQLRTMSYCGRRKEEEQQEEEEDRNDCHNNHEVYSLPIVMNEDEWESSSIEDKSFVLIYNTALCNHLWGMELLVTLQQQQQQNQHTIETTSTTIEEEDAIITSFNNLSKLCEHAFNVAKSLYRLTIENVSSEVVGVDTICYVALFNNISHVCKTLLPPGYNCNSQESYQYDILLLKAIYWWKYNVQTGEQRNTTNNNNSSSSSSSSTLASTTASSASSTTVMMAMDVDVVDDTTMRQQELRPQSQSQQEQERIMAAADGRTINNSYYAENDIDIIDSFLENVFYLIGAQSTTVPASAA